jgi:hypothetical protein
MYMQFLFARTIASSNSGDPIASVLNRLNVREALLLDKRIRKRNSENSSFSTKFGRNHLLDEKAVQPS